MPVETVPMLGRGTDTTLHVNIGCSRCGGPLELMTGTRRTFEDVGRQVFLIVACTPCRQSYEVTLNMVKTDLSNPRISGAEQRARRRERLLEDA